MSVSRALLVSDVPGIFRLLSHVPRSATWLRSLWPQPDRNLSTHCASVPRQAVCPFFPDRNGVPLTRKFSGLISQRLCRRYSRAIALPSQDERVANCCRRPTPVDGFFSRAWPVVSIYSHVRGLLPSALGGDGQQVILDGNLIPTGLSVLRHPSVAGGHHAG